MKIPLNDVLAQAQYLFYKYCKLSVTRGFNVVEMWYLISTQDLFRIIVIVLYLQCIMPPMYYSINHHSLVSIQLSIIIVPGPYWPAGDKAHAVWLVQSLNKTQLWISKLHTSYQEYPIHCTVVIISLVQLLYTECHINTHRLLWHSNIIMCTSCHYISSCTPYCPFLPHECTCGWLLCSHKTDTHPSSVLFNTVPCTLLFPEPRFSPCVYVPP